MKDIRKQIRYTAHMKRVFAAVLLVSFSVDVRAAAGVADDYRVTSSGGHTAVIPQGTDAASPAAAGLPLNPGDRILTGEGGHVEIAAKNGTVFRLEPNSSFAIERPTARWSAFRLQLGRLIAKFAPSPNRPYQVATPVAVAAVRGTELILDVTDTGALQGGVVEGEVDFEPTAEADAALRHSPAWAEATVGADTGIAIQPNTPPQRLDRIPDDLRPAVLQLPSLRERVPQLKSYWKDLPPSERDTLRANALRSKIDWTPPPSLRDKIAKPVPARPAVPRPAPPKPRKK